MDANTNKQPLPRLRSDIEIYKGPDAVDGSPTYNLYDPIAERYYKVSWAETVIFQLLEPDITLEQLKGKIHRHSTLEVTDKDILDFYKLMAHYNFLLSHKPSEVLI